MSKTCSRCGVVLLVDTEVDRKYSTGGGRSFIGAGAGNRAMDYLAQKQRDKDAAGVTCAVCGRNFCSKCMLTYGKRHPTSGGLACLHCGGQNLALEDVETALGYPEERYAHDTLTALREFKSTIAGAF